MQREELLDSLEEHRFMLSHRNMVRHLGIVTHFSKQEVEHLLLLYLKLNKVTPLNEKLFRVFVHEALDLTDKFVVDRIYSVVESPSAKVMAMENFVRYLSVCLRGTLCERTWLAFRVYDLNDAGYITKENMFHFLRNALLCHAKDEDPVESVKEIIDILMNKCDIDRDGRLDMTDFSAAVRENNLLLDCLGECMPSRNAIHAFFFTLSSLNEFPYNRIKL